ncbi:MAG: XdhC family protein [Proteobacteria bacterium]|nr:XdhC family protein [Pseudomonadota bacterium]
MLTSPYEIFPRAQELKEAGQAFVMATVIRVRGSTSAKIGSKALFSHEGINLYGYVGGGCAESHLAQEACAALQERLPRIVEIDLDDDVFGLMPCGGVMDIYLEPHFPASCLSLPNLGVWNTQAAQLLRELGFLAQFDQQRQHLLNHREDLFAFIARLLQTGKSLQALRNSKGIGLRPQPLLEAHPQNLLVFGQTRITEEFCRLAMILGWQARVYLTKPEQHGMPSTLQVCEMPLNVSSLDIPPGAWVVIASHHRQDAAIAGFALAQDAAYVSLVASEKRARLIVADLYEQGLEQKMDRFFAPAGLNILTETPTQMAFSMICEILACSNPKIFSDKIMDEV